MSAFSRLSFVLVLNAVVKFLPSRKYLVAECATSHVTYLPTSGPHSA